ncbi:MAG: hypothetical protein ACR2JB_15925 [Bryobacteraceae bacterium]
MIASAVFVTTIVFIAIGLFLMQECQFLIPYRHIVFGKYGSVLAMFSVALFLNLFAAVYVVCRLVFLKDTGRKLAHLDKQLRTGALSEELSRRLED